MPIGIRGMIYAYLTLDEILKKLCCLSTEEREFIAKTELMDWKPTNFKAKNQIHDMKHMKTIGFKFNSELLTR